MVSAMVQHEDAGVGRSMNQRRGEDIWGGSQEEEGRERRVKKTYIYQVYRWRSVDATDGQKKRGNNVREHTQRGTRGGVAPKSIVTSLRC